MRVRGLGNRSHVPWRCNPLRFWGGRGSAADEGAGFRQSIACSRGAVICSGLGGGALGEGGVSERGTAG